MWPTTSAVVAPAGPAEENAVGVGTGRIAGIDLPPQGRGVGEVVDLEPCPAGPRGGHNRHVIAEVVIGGGLRPDPAEERTRDRSGEQERCVHRELGPWRGNSSFPN